MDWADHTTHLAYRHIPLTQREPQRVPPPFQTHAVPVALPAHTGLAAPIINMHTVVLNPGTVTRIAESPGHLGQHATTAHDARLAAVDRDKSGGLRDFASTSIVVTMRLIPILAVVITMVAGSPAGSPRLGTLRQPRPEPKAQDRHERADSTELLLIACHFEFLSASRPAWSARWKTPTSK